MKEIDNDKFLNIVKDQIDTGMDWLDSIEEFEKSGIKIGDRQFKYIVDVFIEKEKRDLEGSVL